MRAGPVGLVVLWASVTAVLTMTAWLAVEVVADEVGGDQASVLSAAAVSSAAGDATPTPLPSASSAPATLDLTDACHQPLAETHRERLDDAPSDAEPLLDEQAQAHADARHRSRARPAEGAAAR